MNFFYDELNKQAQINAVLDDSEETQEAIIGSFENPSDLIGNIGNDYYDNPDESQFIYGKLNKEIEIVGNDYTGITSETASTIVDNQASSIKVNVNTDVIATIDFVTTSVGNFDTKLKSEADERTASDDELRNKIDNDLSILSATLTERIDAIDAELKVVEEELEKLVDLETDKLEELIRTEAETRESNDNTLQENIDGLSTTVQTEITNRTNATNRLTGELEREVAQRIEADTAFRTELATETQKRTSEHIEIGTRIDNEIKARTDADNALSLQIASTNSNLGQEALDRQNADKLLQDNIDAEASARADDISDLDDKKLDKTNADRNVLTQASFTYSGDNVYSKHDYINLKTLESDTQEHLFKLANDTTAGLMATADYKSIRDLQSRVQNLEAKTTRLLYNTKTNPTSTEINKFVTDLGYKTPFEGIAVVVSGTYHIWHFYEGGVGWKDDGADTVTNFTNTTSGTILGSAVDGKVYAETEGTGSVYGWGDLKARVTNTETSLTNTNTKLTNEITRSTEKDTALEASIANLQSQITSNDEDIAGLETTKATKKELSDEVATLNETINTVNTTLSNQLSTEATTRENTDKALDTKIESIWSSKDSTGSAQAAIAEEQRARIAEDTRIIGLLDAEIANRGTAESTLQSNIDKEKQARETADTTLQINIDNVAQDLAEETTARQTADSTLQTNIDAKLDRVDGSTTTQAYGVGSSGQQTMFQIAQGVTSNALVRRNGTQIKVAETPSANDDATSKKYVDDTISSNISNEASIREGADNALQVNINTLSTDLQTEITNRTNADATLQDTKVTKVTGVTRTSAYITNTDGTQGVMPISSDYMLNALASWNARGCLTTATPVVDSNAANKKYVDDADANLENKITTLDTAINKSVVTSTSFTYDANNVTSTHTKTNLKTGTTEQETHTFNLANNETAGLMSKEDVQAISDLQARVGNLENKTTRLLFPSQNADATTINTFVTGLGYTSPFEGIAVVVEMADGTHHI